MADFESEIRLNIDTSEALAAIKALQKQISEFQTSMARGTAAQQQAAKQLQQQLLNSINTTGQFSATFQRVQTTAESFTNSLEKNKLSFGQYFKYAAASTKTFGNRFNAELEVINKTARERVKDLQTQYIKLGRDASGAMQSIAVRPLKLDLADLGTQTAINAQKQQIFNQLLKQGSTNLLNFGKNTQWAGRQLMVGFTIPLSIFGTKAAQTFMELEEQVIKFRKVYGDLFTSPEERNQALINVQELAKGFTKYGIAVSDTIGLASEAAAAGFAGTDLMAQTEQATRLAVLGQLDQQKALETTISLQNSFKLSSLDLADSINFLNSVENQTVVSLDDITTAIPKVAPVIQSLGGNVKDLAFFLAAMKEGGVNASEGANALKSGLAALINPTSKAAEMLASMGVNIRQIVQNNAGNLKGTVLGVADALNALDPLSRARAIEELFGKFQFARMSTLFDNITRDGSQAARVLDLTTASAGELAASAEQELGMTSASAMNKFKKAIEDLQVAIAPIGEVFLNIATPIVDFASKVLENFNNLDNGVKTFVAGLVGLFGVIGPVALMTFGLLANGVANIVKGFIAVRNIFSKTGEQSNILGEQIDYMTEAELKGVAVAASLEQAHNQLKQVFTSEAEAIERLVAAYDKAIKKQREYGGTGIKTSVGGQKPKKMKDGGIVVVPGSGSGDKVPAMLEPGEAVIPKAMTQKYGGLINGMIADNIPGYQRGKTAGNERTNFAHVTGNALIPVGEILKELQDGKRQVTAGMRQFIQDLVTDFGEQFKIFSYSGFGFTQREDLNIAMRNGGSVPVNDFADDFDAQGIEKWNRTLKLGNVKLNDVVDELTVYDNNLSAAVRQWSELTGEVNITSDQFQLIEAEVRKLLPEASDLRKAFNYAEATILELRANISQELMKETGMTMTPIMSRSQPGVQRGVAGVGKSGRRFRQGTNRKEGSSRGLLGGLTFDELGQNVSASSLPQTGVAIVKQAVAAVALGAKKELEINSPSKVTEKIGEDAGAGLAKGMKKGIDRYRDPSTGKFAKKPGTVAEPIMSSVQNSFDALNSKVMNLSFAFSSVSAIASTFGFDLGEAGNALFALSNVVAVVSSIMSLINIEQLKSLAILKAKNITEAKNTILQNLSGRFAAGKAAVEGGKIFSGGLKGILSNLTSFFGGFGGVIGKVAGAFLRFIPAIGIATAAFFVIQTIATAIENQKKSIEGLGDTANLAADKLKYLAEKTNTQINESANLGPGYVATTDTDIQVTQDTKSAIDSLRQDSEEFKKQFDSTLYVLANSAPEAAQSALANLTLQLDAAGFAPETIAGIIQALKEESKNEQLDLSFLKINAGGKLDLESIKQTAQQAFDQVNQQISRFKTPGSTGNVTSASGYNLASATAQTGFPVTSAGGYALSSQNAMAQNPQVLAAVQAAASAAASQIQNLNSKISQGVISASDYDKEFNSIVANISALPEGKLRELAMMDLAKTFGGEEFATQLEKVTSQADKLMLLEAEMKGIKFTTDDIDQLVKNGPKSVAIRQRILKETKAQAAQILKNIELEKQQQRVEQAGIDLQGYEEEIDKNKQILDMAPQLAEAGLSQKEAIDALTDAKWNNIFATAKQKDLEEGTSKYTQQAITAYRDWQTSIEGVNGAMATADLSNQITELQKQNDVLTWLKANGMPTAKALEVIGNSSYYAAAAAAMANNNFAAFNDQLGQIQKLSANVSGGGGGGGQKSPFQQALETLNDQRKEAGNMISAYNKLRNSGMDVARAFDAAKDPVIATALATTKVKTDKWKQLVSLINQAARAAKNAAVLNAFAENTASSTLVSVFSNIAPLLSRMGLSLEDMQNILNDPTLAQALVDDLKDGVINSRAVLNYIKSIPTSKRIEIKFDMSTPEGMMKQFDDMYSGAMSMLDVQQRGIERSYAASEKAAEEAVIAAENNVNAIQDKIDGIQTRVDDKQRQIELLINRPIERLEQQVAEIERAIELEFDRPIADMQEQSSDLSRELELMDRVAQKVNDRFDAQAKSLEKVNEVNADIIEQDKTRLSIADALAGGNIAEASRAIRQARIDEQKRARERAAKAIEIARENELAKIRSASGLTREQIEARQLEISDKIYSLEEQREAKQKQIQVIQDEIYKIESGRQAILNEIRVLEDDIYSITNSELKQANDRLKTAQDHAKTLADQKQAELDALQDQRDAWEDLKDQANLAMLEAKGYGDKLDAAKKLVNDIRDAWKQVGTETANANARITADTSNKTVSTGNGNGGTNNTTGGGKKINPAYTEAKNSVDSLTTQLATAQANVNKYAGLKTKAENSKKAAPPAARSVFDNQISEYGKLVSQWSSTVIWTGRALNEAKTKLSKTAQYLSSGGKVKGYNIGGLISRGSDTVPAMLTPGEFVVSKYGVQKMGVDNLKAINKGAFEGNSVYNYEVNVNVKSDSNPDQIARAVMTQIKQIDSQRIRSNRI